MPLAIEENRFRSNKEIIVITLQPTSEIPILEGITTATIHGSVGMRLKAFTKKKDTGNIRMLEAEVSHGKQRAIRILVYMVFGAKKHHILKVEGRLMLATGRSQAIQRNQRVA